MTAQVISRHYFAVMVDNEPGVLARVIGLFSARGYNIESLTVDEVDRAARLSRITIVTTGTPMVVNQIKAQLGRLVPVRQVINLTEQGRFVEGSLAFIKLIGDAGKREEATLVARRFGARVADTTENAIIFEITSGQDKIERMIEQLGDLAPIEIARTGSVAMACGEDVLSIPCPLPAVPFPTDGAADNI
ncbi:MAG: acetolactate synthase small subunit [Pseudomonadota bacterium]|nr:acetolactate synthase small subunit [Pseudomonadota bacterium]